MDLLHVVRSFEWWMKGSRDRGFSGPTGVFGLNPREGLFGGTSQPSIQQSGGAFTGGFGPTGCAATLGGYTTSAPGGYINAGPGSVAGFCVPEGYLIFPFTQ